jgi:hypothetical protein
MKLGFPWCGVPLRRTTLNNAGRRTMTTERALSRRKKGPKGERYLDYNGATATAGTHKL